MSTNSDPMTRRVSTPRRSCSSGWQGLVLRLHFYGGLFVAPFILVAAVTGVLYALTPQLETLLYAGQLRVSPTGRQLALADQIRAAVATEPGGQLAAVRPAPEPGATTRVLFDDHALRESERRTVFVDPGTGEVKGTLVTYGSSGVLPLRTTIDQLHRNLVLGEPGRLYCELAASWLWVVALGGLALWIARWRARRSAGRASVPDLIRPERGASGPRRIVTRHGALGIWVLLGALFLSSTGLTWSTYAGRNVAALRAALGWSAPTLRTDLAAARTGHDPGSRPARVDLADEPARFEAVLTVARTAGVDCGAVEIVRPTTPGSAWTVSELKRSWPTEVDAVAVDAEAGRVVDQVRFRDYPLNAKLARWGIDTHMGVLFGWANQIAMVVFGVGITAMIVLGYRIWWRRRPTRARGRRLLPRAQLRQATLPAATVAVLLAAAVGCFAPLFGISLLGFAVIDEMLGWHARRRASEANADTPSPVDG